MKRNDLILDVGMHCGEDTQHYLARGFKVVAVEANPELAARMQERFAAEIRAGQLTVIGAAIASQTGTAELAVSEQVTIWSSLDPRFISQKSDLYGVTYRTVEVPTVRFADVLAEYGVPHYLKVDIEGSDMLCVRALHEAKARPDYLSIESAVTAPGVGMIAMLDELAELWALGYRGFKYIDQGRLGADVADDASGPFGEQTPGRWLAFWPALARATVIRSHFDLCGVGGRWGDAAPGRAIRRVRAGLMKRGTPWFDLHAKLGDPS